MLGEYRIFTEKDLDALVQQLLRADLVIGFNVIQFRLRGAEGYTIVDLPHQCRTLGSTRRHREEKLGHRLGLDAVSNACLGVGKTADGLDAIKWWRQGKMLEIAEYCCYDVKCTKLVHEYGVTTSASTSRQVSAGKKTLPIEWSLS
jgi:DEAD/DEAH box helicase domain-containing protein